MTEIPEVPDVVSVTGTSATPDAEVTMLEGATGARIPTGEHRRSGAMPAEGASGSDQQAAVLWFIVAAVVLVLVVVAVFLVTGSEG